MQNKRLVLITPEINCSNPALLQNFKDSIILDANIFYNYNKGDFVNYYEPNQSFKTGATSNSYVRINEKLVVYGLASYYYSKGKNCGATTFLYPYRVPFNFIPTADSTKGDRRIEQYRLSGSISYKLLSKLSLGAKIDYQTISFAKLKDMRNINDILELNFYSGIDYSLYNNGSIGFSYHYNRYIENIRIDKYGKGENNYYALINKGAFMGLLHTYDNINGILKTKSNRPWVEIVHKLGLQYTHNFDEITKFLFDFNYGIGKGHYGNDHDNSVVYTKHTTNIYMAHSQLSLKGTGKTHIINIFGNYDKTINNDQLYREVNTINGNSITQYYGTRQSLTRKKIHAKIAYHVFLGQNYMNAPWHFNFNYTYNLLRRKAIYFPYYRKQNIERHKFDASIEKSTNKKDINYLIKSSIGFAFGNGGFPNDGISVAASNSTKPDYLNNLLQKERDYLISKRMFTGISLRVSKNIKKNSIYTQLDFDYTNAFDTKFTNGSFLNCSLSLGIEF